MTVRRTKKNGKPVLLIDFRYIDVKGYARRFRKVAEVQTMGAAKAEELRLRLQVAQTGQVQAPVRKKTMLLRDFVSGPWRAWSLTRHKPSTRVRYEALLGQGLLKAFGGLHLDEIDEAVVTRYASRVAARGIQAWPHVSLVQALLRAAVELGELDTMPKLCFARRRRSKLPDCPEASEVEAMLEVASDWLRVAVALAAYAGLRCGEVRALEVRDVDWQRGRLMIRRAMSEDVVTTTKSDKERIVPIAPQLAPILRAACQGKTPHCRVVRTREATTPTRQAVLYRLTRTQLRHNLPHRSFHSLRHFFCTHLLRQGADVELVRVVAGHHNLATTMRYLHARADDALRYMGPIRALPSGAVLN